MAGWKLRCSDKADIARQIMLFTQHLCHARRNDSDVIVSDCRYICEKFALRFQHSSRKQHEDCEEHDRRLSGVVQKLAQPRSAMMGPCMCPRPRDVGLLYVFVVKQQNELLLRCHLYY